MPRMGTPATHNTIGFIMVGSISVTEFAVSPLIRDWVSIWSCTRWSAWNGNANWRFSFHALNAIASALSVPRGQPSR